MEDILIIERDKELGGILNQCIHAGFGLHTFGQELTGPEYAGRFISRVQQLHIPYLLRTMVLDLSRDRVLTVTGPETGLIQIQAQAVILAMGCRGASPGRAEYPRLPPGGHLLCRNRPAPGEYGGLYARENVVILGSGDIGLRGPTHDPERGQGPTRWRRSSPLLRRIEAQHRSVPGGF